MARFTHVALPVVRSTGITAPRAARRIRAWFSALLRVPLAAKLAGSSALLVLIVCTTLLILHDEGVTRLELIWLIAAVSSASLLASLVLVHLALRPLRDLETTAARVAAGDMQARVPPSPLADRNMARIGDTINALLGRLATERLHIGQLAAQVIEASDRERSRLAHQLHDSTAQTLAALSLQAAGALRDATGDAERRRLELIQLLAVEALEEVRLLSQTVHPRVLDDLGIAAALDWLARRIREQYGTDATVELPAPFDGRRISRPAASILYHVAQEAMMNAVRHAHPDRIRIILELGDGTARLQVADDGTGFVASEARQRRRGMGLFTMTERVALAEGTLDIDSAPGRGTRITATIPTTRSKAQGGR